MPPTQRVIPGLGNIQSATLPNYSNIEQYRGLKYGDVSARFRQAKLVTDWKGSQYGPNYGPICPYPRFIVGSSIVQKPLKREHESVMNEFECLNLNITCPKKEEPGKGWPVVVWIHGGANVMGSGSDPQYDAAPLVSFSVEQDLPIVMVTINYRLGILGFLASSDIKKDNEQDGDLGVGNYGVRDQLLAFEWVKRYISAFGGDPSRITAMGESAGSIDTHIIMCSDLFSTHLPFSQAILQSGVAPLTVRTIQHQEELYSKYIGALGIKELSPAERVRRLREISPDDLFRLYLPISNSPLPSWQATVDGYFLTSLPKFSDLPLQTYHSSVRRILIGDCADEGVLWTDRVKKLSWDASRVHQLAASAMGNEESERLLSAYDITMGMEPDKLVPRILRLLTDAEFGQPIEAVAKSFSNGPVFYYHMREGNPFDGPKKGIAHHGVDLLYPFLTYNSHLPEPLVKMSQTIASQWLNFINGREPWTPHDQSNSGRDKIMMYGPDGRCEELEEREKSAYDELQLCSALQDDVSAFAAKLRGEIIY